jgi:cytoskeletal protein CcmA (bactofilin family)
MTQGGAQIGQGMTVKGDISSQEDLYVDGEVEGSIEVAGHVLTIGPAGKVEARIRARNVIIAGTVTGNVEALQKIVIRKDANLTGDIKTAGISIEDGAYFKGSIDIVPSEGRAETASA